MQRGGHILIHRESGGKSIRKAIKVIRSGPDVCIYAEGHRYNDNCVHEFEDGAAWLAILSRCWWCRCRSAHPPLFNPCGAIFATLALRRCPDGDRQADRTEVMRSALLHLS